MSRIVTVADHAPVVAETAFVAANAVVAGNVELGDEVSVWFGSVIRSEVEPITIAARSNIQDLTTVHADPGFPVTVGERVTVGHRCVLHGCTIEDDALIGMGAVVMNGAVVGQGAVVGAGAVVTEGTQVPPMTLALGVPAKVLTGKWVPEVPRANVAGYVALSELYAQAERAGA